MVCDTNGLNKGEVKLSARRTAQAWGWCIGSVSKFIHMLIEEGMLWRTERTSIYTIMPIIVNKTMNASVNTLDADNQRSYEEQVNTLANTMPNTPPFYIKERKEKTRVREAESVAPDANEAMRRRYDRFTQWASENIPNLNAGIDIAIFGMMYGQAYHDTRKMGEVLEAMERDGFSGSKRQVMREFERRCPR